MKLSSLVWSCSALTLVACGVKLPGGVTIPGGNNGGGSSATAPGGGTAPSPDAPPSQPVGNLAPYYAGLELAALYHLIHDERQSEIYDRAKAELGRDPLWQSPNPDPTWILDWRQKDWTNASENAEALTQAAFNRAWEASCVAEYAASRKTHADLAAKHGPELARVDGLTNYYERLAGYAALSAQFEADAVAAGLEPNKDPFGPVGFRVTILAHAVAFHRQSRHAWAEFPWQRFPAADRIRRDDGGRELTSDDAFERGRYCATVSSMGGLRTTPFTAIWGDGHMSAKRVAWPTVTGDERAHATRAKALVAAAQASLALDGAARVEVISKLYGLSAPPNEPKLAGFFDLKVTAIKGATATVTGTETDRYPYGCKVTNRIDRITDNGKIIYQQICKYGDHDYRLDAAVTFDELPPGVTLAVGDVLSFAADVEKDGHKRAKDSAAKKLDVRTMVLTGRHLHTVKRGKEALTW